MRQNPTNRSASGYFFWFAKLFIFFLTDLSFFSCFFVAVKSSPLLLLLLLKKKKNSQLQNSVDADQSQHRIGCQLSDDLESPSHCVPPPPLSHRSLLLLGRCCPLLMMMRVLVVCGGHRVYGHRLRECPACYRHRPRQNLRLRLLPFVFKKKGVIQVFFSGVRGQGVVFIFPQTIKK